MVLADVLPFVPANGWCIALGGRSSELVVDHMVNEAGCGCEAQLIECPPLVGTDGFGAQVQFGCDLTGTPAGRKREQDLGFLAERLGWRARDRGLSTPRRVDSLKCFLPSRTLLTAFSRLERPELLET